VQAKGSKKSRSFEEPSYGPFGSFRQSPQCLRFGKAPVAMPFVQLAEASNISVGLRGILVKLKISFPNAAPRIVVEIFFGGTTKKLERKAG